MSEFIVHGGVDVTDCSLSVPEVVMDEVEVPNIGSSDQ